MRIITLTTDFGTRDWFVGTMKGVILGINPRATLVDITHEIPPGDIRAAAFVLASSYQYFPEGTIHMVVVDPGVGSGRKAIVIQTARYFFVGPDNGVLSLAVAAEKIKAIRSLENPKYQVQPRSRTFHGRDLFAPAAAHLACGLSMRSFGRALHSFKTLSTNAPRVTPSGIQGEVQYVDCFGNCITNISQRELARLRGPSQVVITKGQGRFPIKEFYDAVPAGKPVAVISSMGFLEIAINGDSAAARFQIKVGDRIRIQSGNR
jgi:S-adenosyl-L-methionine hydrolase (adenosine-forming)